MKILLLTQYFPPEFGAAAARNSEHAQLWAEAGHEVEICTGFPNYPAGKIAPEYRGKRYAREETDGYVVHRTWLYATPNRSFLQRALASLSFMGSAFFCGLFKCAKPDVIIASSGPFFVGPLGWLLSICKRAPLVFEVRDLLPQQAVDTGLLRNPLLIVLMRGIEEFLYRRAAAVVTVAAACRNALMARGVDEAKITSIENGVREALFRPLPDSRAFRARHGLEDRFLAVYVGAHGVSQGLGTLLEVAETLQDIPGFTLVFIGEGADKPVLIEDAERRGLDNVLFLPLCPKEEMPDVYAAADLCFVPLRKGDYFKLNIPSKLFEIMACGRPVILGAEGQAAEILEAAEAGIAVPPEDVDACASAVRRLRGDEALRQAMGGRGRAYVLKHFTRAKKAAAYLDVLRSVLNDG